MLVELRDVAFQYRREKSPVLRGVNLELPPGARVALVGPSGSGKTTLLSIVAGALRPTDGAIEWTDETNRRRRHSPRHAWIFQGANAVGRRRVADNCCLPLLALGVRRREALAQADEWLSKVGLSALAGRLANSLSGGELQRLAIARALTVDPPLLLADEPTGNLDEANSEVVVSALLKAVSPTTTVLCATHDLTVADRFDTVLRVENGAVLADR